MLDPSSSLDADFSAQLQALVAQAEQELTGRASPQRSKQPESRPVPATGSPEKAERPPAATEPPALPKVLEPLFQHIETLTKTQQEQAAALSRIEKAVASQEPVTQVLTEARQSLDQRNTVNKAMFEALHGELKGYKDSFLLESVLRPVVRDLISLYDDVCEVHRQMNAAIADAEVRGGVAGGGIVLLENVQQSGRNLEHNALFIVEVLERIQVTMLPSRPGKLDKLTQRAVAVEMAEDPDEDLVVVKVAKRGFLWKDRVIRPEEVVVKKWKEGYLVALNPSSSSK